jgi:cytoskeletal protein CcmA (bactofilin family)
MSVWGAQKSTVEAGQKTAPPPKVPPEPATPKPKLTLGGGRVAHIGKSITIRGDLHGEEDLLLDGRIEGRVELSNHHLTIGPNTEHIQAELSAKEVTIRGRVVGNVTAKVRVEITESGCLDGDVVTPRLCVREGGELNGKVTMKASADKTPAKDVAASNAVQTTDESPRRAELEAR